MQHGIRPVTKPMVAAIMSNDAVMVTAQSLQTDATCKAPGPNVDVSGTKRGKNSTRWMASERSSPLGHLTLTQPQNGEISNAGYRRS